MTPLLKYSLPLEKQDLRHQINPCADYKTKTFYFSDYYAEIMENNFDCGCLILGYVDGIDSDFQEKLESFMHQNGFSKVLFTISTSDIESINQWTDLGYIAIDTGRSSRHPERTLFTYLLYKVIEPKVKGYV